MGVEAQSGAKPAGGAVHLRSQLPKSGVLVIHVSHPSPGSCSTVQEAQISTLGCTHYGQRIHPTRVVLVPLPFSLFELYAGKLGQGKSCSSLISQSGSLRCLATGDLLPLPPIPTGKLQGRSGFRSKHAGEGGLQGKSDHAHRPPLSAYKTLELVLTSQWFLGDTRQSNSSVTAPAPGFSASHRSQSWTLGFCYCQKDFFLLQVLDNAPLYQVGTAGLQHVREGDGFAKAPKLAELDKGEQPTLGYPM
jgi:hypothetical protein